MGVLKAVIAAHAGSPTGTDINLTVPQFYNDTSNVNNGTYYSAAALVAANPNHINDTDYTLIVNNASQTKATNLGFTNLINVENNTSSNPYLIYIGEHNYIKAYSQGTNTVLQYYQNDTFVTAVSLTGSSYAIGIYGYLNGLENESCGYFYIYFESGSSMRFRYDYVSGQTTGITAFWSAYTPPPPPPSDPYAPGGNSDSSSSAGTFTNTGSDVGLPSLPSVDPSATGFMKAYNPSGTDLNNFANYLWNTLDIGALKSLYSNPMEAVIGLLMIPASPTVGAAQTVNLGNVATTVSMPIITNRFKEIDCGTVTIPEWWGAYLDYSPYTEVSIYLPYVGVQQLDTNEIMGKPVHVVYHIDVLTGALIALLECGGKCIYHFAGNCGVQIPITASSFGGVLQTALSVGMSAIQSIASQAAGNFQTVSEVATSVFSGAKTRVQKSGSLGSAAGFADNQIPFFIIQRPVQCKPEDQNKFSGYPSYITDTLSDLTGYTEVELIQLSDMPATDTEREEIDSLLRAGVIL